jgi:cell cycle sensor histidine kinase DivJ
VMTRVYQHDRPRILFDQVNDALILINGTNGDIVKANKKASMLLGYPHKQLESLSVAAIHPHDLNDAMEFLERVLRDGHGTTDKFSCKTRSGELIPAELSAGVVPIAGKPHVLISIRDVSHQIVTQERLRELVDAAERANRQKSEFLASISHDLRTELNAIIGFSTMIETEMLGKHAVPAYRDYASHIKESGEHLLDLVNESFDRSKIKTGKAT